MENLEEKTDLIIKEIAKRIKSLRLSKGYTSYEIFAFENELNRVQYWRIETGHNITMKTLLKVLSIHDITLEDFFKNF